MSTNKIVKIAAGIIVVLVAAFFVKALIMPSSPNNAITDSSTADSPTGQATGTVTDAKQSGDVQEVTLGWGKLNYDPEVIRVQKGKPVRVIGDLNTLYGCFRSFQIPELGISQSFTEGNDIIEFTPQKTGTFGFGCSMGMGNGKLVVV